MSLSWQCVFLTEGIPQIQFSKFQGTNFEKLFSTCVLIFLPAESNVVHVVGQDVGHSFFSRNRGVSFAIANQPHLLILYGMLLGTVCAFFWEYFPPNFSSSEYKYYPMSESLGDISNQSKYQVVKVSSGGSFAPLSPPFHPTFIPPLAPFAPFALHPIWPPCPLCPLALLHPLHPFILDKVLGSPSPVMEKSLMTTHSS